jgi:hypothetical protein
MILCCGSGGFREVMRLLQPNVVLCPWGEGLQCPSNPQYVSSRAATFAYFRDRILCVATCLVFRHTVDRKIRRSMSVLLSRIWSK